MSMHKCLSAFLAGAVLINAAYANPSVEVVTRDDFELIPLNPLRGDASPKAGVLWGDLREDVASGALIQFADGFSSPPHIHNITYRAVVIEGVVHNDDPTAAMFWMEPGSFWTQPAGETHITAVGPGGGLAFLEIEAGPYLVRPSEEAFDNGERPINNEARNVVWLTAADTTWISGETGAEISFLWGEPSAGARNGSFVRLDPGSETRLHTDGTPLKLVLAMGELAHSVDDLSDVQTLTSGSYVGSEGEVSHNITCNDAASCLLYVSATGTYRISGAE
ncbi:DUF4437 domain-containing protein [Ruegeria sp.]|uniref:DUF4437 domain-containing protein n=1 Tax=Ruegeria sp. TaxID=1879320 RepID=UPI003B5C9077